MTITIIGELCHDTFVYGEVVRLCPEAPVPVLTNIKTENNFGMAGNVKRNLLSFNSSLQINLIHQKRSIKKTRYIDDKTNYMFLRVDEGEENVDRIILTPENIEEIVESDIVIVSDYNKGFLDEETTVKIGKMSKFSVIDTKKRVSNGILESFDYIKLNEYEYLRNKEIADKYNEKFIITLGMKGARHKNTVYESPSPKQTIDVSGAGDTFTAFFSLRYHETKDIGQSISFANEMASIVVSKRGVTTPF